jgi:CDP-diacylglycerol--serine O-phosphatidyltransferase
MKRHLPNLLTLGNLSCGVAAIYLLLTAPDKHGYIAVALVLLAALLDFLDGFVARWLRVSGELGKQLDSLADMVTFGIVPGFFALNLIGLDTFWGLGFVVVLIPVLSAYRLAKFTIDTRQTDSFLGVPTPANTLLWLGLFALSLQQPHLTQILQQPIVFVGLVVFSSLLMIVEFPMLALKFKKGGDNKPVRWLLFLAPCGLFVVKFGLGAAALIYFHYLLCSVLFKFADK